VSRPFPDQPELSASRRDRMAVLLTAELSGSWRRAVAAGASPDLLAGILTARRLGLRAATGNRVLRRDSANPVRRRPPARNNGAMSERFIGRAEELARLHALLSGAAGGRAVLATVSGAAGVGKSRLLDEFRGQARTADAHVLFGACARDGVIPYAPLVDTLRRLVRENGPQRAAQIAGPGWNVLAGMISAFTGAPQDARPVERLQVFGAVLRMLDHLGGDAPTVLVFEDLHWADEATMELLSYLARTLTTERVLLLASHRSDLPRGNLLRTQLADRDLRRRMEDVPVPPFTEAETREFVHELGHLDRDAARRCHRWSEGNAFFAEQLVAFGTPADPDAGRVPPSINELMLARIRMLSRPALSVLRVAATATHTVDDRLLAAVCKLDDEQLDDTVHECLEQGMLVVDPDEDAYRPQHALLGAAAYDDMIPSRRRRLHTLMAEAMTADPTLGPAEDWEAAVELAHHWHRAGEDTHALSGAVRAGGATMRVRAFHEAEAQYRRALGLWTRVGDAEQLVGPRGEILAAAADAARWAGHGPQAVAWIQEAIDALDADADPLVSGGLHERLGGYLWEAGNTPEGRRAYARAAELLEIAAPTSGLHARALAGMAMMDVRASAYDSALTVARRAAKLAEDCDDRGAEGRALNAAGLALTMLGRGQEGEPLLRKALDIADETGHLEDLLRAYANLSMALERMGDQARAVDTGLKGLARARGFGMADGRQATVLANNAAASMVPLGRWDEAIALLDEALLGTPRGQTLYPRLTRAEIDVARGRFEQAEILISEVRDHHTGDPMLLVPLHAYEAELWCWQDQPLRALDTVHSGIAAIADVDDTLFLLRLCAVGLRAAADLRERGAVRAAADSAALSARADDAVRDQAVSAEIGALHRLCQAERCRADGADSAAAWSAVAESWDALNRPYPAAYARWRQAAAYPAGDAARSDAAAQAARAADRLGAAPLAAAVAATMAGSSGRKRRAASHPGIKDLTPREVEILELLAAKGLSNHEIGRHLHIADGTVATHLNRIMTKLNVMNRGAAIALAHAEGFFAAPDGPSSTR